jgi:hypothetical protein
MAKSQARYHWDSVTLIPHLSPTHRQTTACFCDHRGRNITDAAGVPSNGLDTWAVPDPTCGVNAPLMVGVVVGVGPPRFPFGVGSPAAPWLNVSEICRY